MHICVYIFICICIHIHIYTCYIYENVNMYAAHLVLGKTVNCHWQSTQGPWLAWYEDCVRWLDKSTWQVITCQVIWFNRAMWQVNLSSQLVKLTSLSSGTCHRKWDLAPTENVCRRWPAISFRESLSRRRRCLRDVLVLFLHVVVCLKNIFSDGQDVKYDCDTTPRQHFFHGTNSHEATQVVHRKWGSIKREDSFIIIAEHPSEFVDCE